MKVPATNYSPQLLTKEQAEECLNPHMERLEKCIQHGWDAWKKDYAHKHHILGPRARAAIVFDEIKANAVHEFAHAPGVTLVPRRGSFLLHFGDDITLRFKKIKRNGMCSYIRTRQQMLFEAQLQLPGILTGTMVHAGYALDDLQREVTEKLVVCQFRNHVKWVIQLPGAAGGMVEVMPEPKEAPKTPKPRFVAKGQDERKKEKAKATRAGSTE